jgi:hypothetical protein
MNLSKYLWLVFIGLLMGVSTGEDLWDLGSSQDWLSAGPVYAHSAYRYNPYYGQPSGFADFYSLDYALPYYSPYYYMPYYAAYYAPDYMPYWYLSYPEPYSTGFVVKSSPRPWWVGSHADLSKTMDYARTRSSLRVYRDDSWQTP